MGTFWTRTVAELEDMLPKYERVEWAKQMSQIDGDTKYTRFKNFLIARKKVLENMDSIGCGVYAVSKQKCSFCSKSGHVEEDCYS